MALSFRDMRHIALVTLIIAALPMLAYPYGLGLKFSLSPIWYSVLELVYFFALASMLNRRRTVMVTATIAVLYLVGRLLLSTVLLLFLIALERLTFAAAASSAFSTFRLALLLFSISTPFLYNAVIRSIVISRRREGRKTVGRATTAPARQLLRPLSPSQSPRAPRDVVQPAAPSRNTGEYFDRSFDAAVQHISGYSGVMCAMVVDSEGLPVAAWERGEYDREMWAAMAKRIVDDVGEISLRAGSALLETLEFKSGGKRASLVRVADMWLLAIADAESDELEKIRMHQAAEMIERHCQERFKNVYSTETGRIYAGSTV